MTKLVLLQRTTKFFNYYFYRNESGERGSGLTACRRDAVIQCPAGLPQNDRLAPMGDGGTKSSVIAVR